MHLHGQEISFFSLVSQITYPDCRNQVSPLHNAQEIGLLQKADSKSSYLSACKCTAYMHVWCNFLFFLTVALKSVKYTYKNMM